MCDVTNRSREKNEEEKVAPPAVIQVTPPVAWREQVNLEVV